MVECGALGRVARRGPNPHPNPRSAPRPALAARALPGTRASGAQAVPYRPGGRGAWSTGLDGP
ncbi:hypothetical protein XaCFBP7622_18855 [Xanthomonas arboricola]|nr:hypothetical protein XaCFBP7622_18855 [Xanthomonas arboricola]